MNASLNARHNPLRSSSIPPSKANFYTCVGVSSTKKGWLQKKSSGFIRRYQWRYFSLENSCLFCFHQQCDSQPSWTINFNQVSVHVQVKTPSLKILILAMGCDRKFKLKASSYKELSDWAIALQYHIQHSDGSKSDKPSTRRFWKYPRISNAAFMKQAQTGDLLLFTSISSFAKVQRGLTRCKFDHVALIIRYSSGTLALFEATGQEGVNIVTWPDFVKLSCHKLFSKIAYRPLVTERTQLLQDKLDEFVSQHKGKKYNFNTKKILFRRKKSHTSEESFFCSELVASAYQHAGLLSTHIMPWKFFPSHFAGADPLAWNECTLGQLSLIDFEL